MTSIILNWKKAADILIGKFWIVKLLYSYMRHLYQMIDYILRHIQISNFASICYNIIILYVQIYHALTFSW